MGLGYFGGNILKMYRNNKIWCFTACFFCFLDQESSWSADQVTGVYIYRRTRVSVLMTLSYATQGVVFPRKRVSLRDMYKKKRGLVIFLGEHS